MIRVYLAAVDLLPTAVVLVPVFLILYNTVYGHDLRKSILYCLFCLYLSAVFVLVGMPNVTYIRPGLNLNLIPFQGMMDDFGNSVLNVALFFPLGIFLPILWDEFRYPRSSVLFGFGFSLTIELLQMLTYRATDVNDLITNMAGVFLGYLLSKPIIRRAAPIGENLLDVFKLLGLSFGIFFFLHPILSPLIWDRIL